MSDQAAVNQSASNSLPQAVREEPSLRPPPSSLQQALDEFGRELVMRASDECRVLPHILHLIGKGGEHIVFEDVRFPNYVLKVDFIETLPVLYAQGKGHAAVSIAVEKLRKKAVDHNLRMQKMRKFFLGGSVPLELAAIKDIPVSEELVQAIIKDRNLDAPKKLVVPEKMSVLATIQHKIVLPKTRVDIYSSYAELNRTILPEYYAEGHRLLCKSDAIGPESADVRNKIIRYIYPSLKKVIETAEQDPGFKKALGDYVRRAIRYSVSENQIIDMAGGGNVMMVADYAFEQPQALREQAKRVEWYPFLMDALSPPELSFDLIKTAALLIKHGQNVEVRVKANALNVINYVRFANALAMISGVSERLDVNGMDDLSPEAWHEGLMIEKYLEVYTPKK